jgi:NADH:ubiquinone oxidoreductase subunit 6 (subunit J)
MNRWLSRLAFSFIVIAAVLAWEGRRAVGAAQIGCYVGAALLFALGVIGLRERHRRRP